MLEAIHHMSLYNLFMTQAKKRKERKRKVNCGILQGTKWALFLECVVCNPDTKGVAV